jgi:hypothetical protein
MFGWQAPTPFNRGRRNGAPDQTVDDCREAQPLGRREKSAFHIPRLRKEVSNELTNKIRENDANTLLRTRERAKIPHNPKTFAFAGCCADVHTYRPVAAFPFCKAAPTKG